MDLTLFPTKGNLMLAKSTLSLSRQGYELLDKKRNVLVREMMELMDSAKEIQRQIDETFSDAYKALQDVNITLGIRSVEQIGKSLPVEDSIKITSRSVMGIEIPMIYADVKTDVCPYGIYSTCSALDRAYKGFEKVKLLTIKLAEVENSVYRLAASIKKTQRRTNALKNITIPKYTAIAKSIESALEEKEREEFSRLKVIKRISK